MTKTSHQKRNWRPWYLLSERPICTNCNIPCIVQRTQTVAGGKRVQYRYCPKCGNPFKTMYRPTDSVSDPGKAAMKRDVG